MPEERVTVYRPPGLISFVKVRETVRFRTLIARLAARDITLRYRQTLLGVVWVIVQPLLAAGVVALVFGGVANLSAGDDVSYFLLAFAGTVWWTATSQTVIRVTGSLVVNAQLVSKVYFPRLVIPVGLISFRPAGYRRRPRILLHTPCRVGAWNHTCDPPLPCLGVLWSCAGRRDRAGRGDRGRTVPRRPAGDAAVGIADVLREPSRLSS